MSSESIASDMMSAIGWIKPPSRRCKRLLLTADTLLELFMQMDGSVIMTATGIPDDARIVGTAAVQDGWTRNATPNVLVFLIESNEFPEVEPGCHYPEMTLEFRADPVKHNDY